MKIHLNKTMIKPLKIIRIDNDKDKIIALSKVHLKGCHFICTSKLLKYFTNVIVFVNKVFNLLSLKWKSNGTKIRSFHSHTWAKLWQDPQYLLNDHFTNVIIQKVIKTKFVNSYRTYVRMKNKMIKWKHNSLYTLTKEWLGDSM